MFRKSGIVVLAIGLVLSGILAGSARADAAASNCAWTNQQFAQFMAQKYGISVGDSAAMSPEANYEALANALAEKGIQYFSGAKSTDKLTCCSAADTLCMVVGIKESAGASCDLAINDLIQKGFLTLPAGSSDPCGTLCNIEEVFNAPLVVESYRPPTGAPETNPPGEGPEDPTSRIQ